MCRSDLVQFGPIWSNLQIRIPSVTGLLWNILRDNLIQARKDVKVKLEKEGDEKKKKIPFLSEDFRGFMVAKTQLMRKQHQQ